MRRTTKSYPKRKTAAPSTRQVATKALSIAKKAISAEETKSHEIGPITGNIGSTAASTVITQIPQGVERYQRLGNKISVLGFQFNYWAYKGTAANALLRVTLVHDTQQIADANAGMAWNNPFESSLTLSLRNVTTQQKRYKVIYDQCHILNDAYPSINLVKKYISFKHPVLFNGAAGTDIQKNGVYLMIQSTEAAGATAPSIQYHLRTLYKDS